MNWVYLLLVGEVVLLLFALTYTQGDYTSPAVITMIMFTLETVCVIRNTEYWNSHISGKTFALVILGLTVINIVEMVVNGSMVKKARWLDADRIREEPPIVINGAVYFLFLSFALIGAFYYIYSVMKVGGTWGLSAISVVKSSTEINVNILAKAFHRLLKQIPYAFLFVFVHNVVLCGQSVKKNINCLIITAIAILGIFFSGSRASVIVLFEATGIYFVMFFRYKKGWKKFHIRKYFKYIIPLAVVLFFFFTTTNELMKGTKSSSRSLWGYFEYYLGSPLHLLDKVVNDPSVAYPVKYDYFGARTFASFWSDLYEKGMVSVNVSGETGDGLFIPLGGSFAGAGNVYTVFSAPYNDFGFEGAIIFVGLYYLLFDLLYYKKIKYSDTMKGSYVWLLLLGYLYNYIFMTFFKTTTTTIKLQTVFEMVIMVLIYMIVTSLKTKRSKQTGHIHFVCLRR